MAPRNELELAEELHDMDTEEFGLDPEITRPIVVDASEEIPDDNLECAA